MKAVVLLITVVLLFCNSRAQADMLGVTLYGDISQLQLRGQGGDHLLGQPLQSADDLWRSWSIAVEHPMPLLPNVALRHQTGNWIGQTQLAGNFQLDGQYFADQTKIDHRFDLTTTDVSFYYEVLDNSLFALDLGATALQYDLGLSVTQPDTSHRNASGFLPLLYSHLTVQLWGLDTSLFWQGFYTDYRDQRWSQTKIGLGYEFVDLTAVTLAVKVGWQHQSVKLINKDQLDADFLMKGAFLALEVDF